MDETREAMAQQPQSGGKRLKETKQSKLWLVPVVLVGLLAAAYLGVCAYAHSLTVFYPGYTINGLDAAGLTAAEAQAMLERDFPAEVVTVQNADGGETLAEFDLSAMGVTAETVSGWAEEAMWHQQNKPFFYKGWLYLGALTGYARQGSVYDAGFTNETLLTVAEALELDLRQAPIHADYALEETTIAYTVPRDGRTLDTAALAEALSTVDNTTYGPRGVFITFETIPADQLSVRELHGALAGEMKNAAYDKAADAIIPEVIGVDFSINAAQAAIDAAQPGETIHFPADITYPQVTAAELKEVLFRDVLGEYTTKVSGTQGRRGNVRLSAAAINGYVMNAGDIFSYNEAVGQRTAANGYAPAPAYVKGETVDEIGGGICQTSSTLYYACLLANLEITERYAHRYAPGYITLGMDATVSWGGPDYRFTNDTLYPVRIETAYEKDTVTVRLLGTKTDDTYAKMTYEYLGKTEWETVYKEDPTVAPGTQVVKTEPYTGHKVKSYHTIYAGDGTVLDRHFEATSDYKVRNKVVLVAPGELPGTQVPAVNPGALPVTPNVPAETTPPSVVPTEPEVSVLPQEPIIAIPEAPPVEVLPEGSGIIVTIG